MKTKKVTAIKKTTSQNKADAFVNQTKLDHDQHYDVDGVTRKDGQVAMTENINLKKKIK